MSRTRTLIVASFAAVALVGAGVVVGASATTAAGGGGGSAADTADPTAFDSVLGGLVGDDDPAAGADPGAPGMGMGDRMGPGHGFRRAGHDRMLHGELVVKGKDGKPVTVVVQRGAVTAVGADSVTVKSEDGYARTWTLNSSTTYRAMRQQATKADLTVGATVRLMGTVVGGTTTARVVGIPPKDTPAPGASGSAGSANTSTA